MSDSMEKGDKLAEVEAPSRDESSEKRDVLAADDKAQAVPMRSRLEPPEFLRNMAPEQRLELETRLKRKIDGRLMPAIIIMYILNYIDR
jgi:hypothetical protein